MSDIVKTPANTANLGTIDLGSMISKSAAETATSKFNDKLLAMYEKAVKDKDILVSKVSDLSVKLAEATKEAKEKLKARITVGSPYRDKPYREYTGEGDMANTIAELRSEVTKEVREELGEKLDNVENLEKMLELERTKVSNSIKNYREELTIARNTHTVAMNNLKEDHELDLKKANHAKEAALANARHESDAKAHDVEMRHKNVVSNLNKKIEKLEEEIKALKEDKDFATLEKEVNFYREKAKTFLYKFLFGNPKK